MQRRSCHFLAARSIASFGPPRAEADFAKPGYSEVVSVASGTSSSNPASSSGESATNRVCPGISPHRCCGFTSPGLLTTVGAEPDLQREARRFQLQDRRRCHVSSTSSGASSASAVSRARTGRLHAAAPNAPGGAAATCGEVRPRAGLGWTVRLGRRPATEQAAEETPHRRLAAQ
jgi:hypothetical protein